MSKWHSTVTRRDFMKAIGLTGGGIGAAMATAPLVGDLSELATSSKANFTNPWYVKELELETASVEIDWSMFKTWEGGTDPGAPSGSLGYNVPDDPDLIDSLQYRAGVSATIAKIQEDNRNADKPGYQIRDYALAQGSSYLSFGRGLESVPWTGGSVTTPDQLGVAKWSGTPEEATNMCRAAAHFYGVAKIGVIELTENTKKLMGKDQVRFENTSEPYEDGRIKVIPNSYKWALVYLIRQPIETNKRYPAYQNIGSNYGYMYGPIVKERLTRFIKCLGYNAVTPNQSRAPMNVGAGAISGIGELCRISHQLTPEWGPMIRYSPSLITDLPLAPTRPIDSGAFRFCADCVICGHACNGINGWTPINLDKEPSWEITGPWNREGVKAYQFYWPRDYFCTFCQQSCPWGTHNLSNIHEMVKAIASYTTIFNGFFADMDHQFGYGRHHTDEYFNSWWDRNLNTWYDDTILH